jgi:cell division septal protein FtsQ
MTTVKVQGRNRRLKQRRPLRARLPTWRGVGRGVARALPGLTAAAVGVALAGAGAVAVDWALTSPRFALRDVAVTGNLRLPREALLQRAGVSEGENLFRLSTRAIERRLRASPWIVEARVGRRLPDGLEIAVVERQPAALLVIEGAGLYLADAAGRPFKRAATDDGEGAGLVVISGLDRRTVTERPDESEALVRYALAIAARWSDGERPPIGELHLDRRGVTLHTLHGGVAIAIGRPPADAGDTLAAILRRFDAVWAALPPAERALARRINLDSPTRPDRVTVSLAEAGEDTR